MFESVPDHRKIILLKFLNQNDNDLLKECGFLRTDINRLLREFKNILNEVHENYLDYVKDQEESNIERILNK